MYVLVRLHQDTRVFRCCDYTCVHAPMHTMLGPEEALGMVGLHVCAMSRIHARLFLEYVLHTRVRARPLVLTCAFMWPRASILTVINKCIYMYAYHAYIHIYACAGMRGLGRHCICWLIPQNQGLFNRREHLQTASTYFCRVIQNPSLVHQTARG